MKTTRLEEKLRKQVVACISDHQMIAADDHILVGLSGGKDSWALLYFLIEIKKRAPLPFSLSAITIDGGLVGLDEGKLRQQCQELGVPFHLERQEIFKTVAEVKDPDSSFCSLCAKLRRGALYTMAKKLKANKIALGHHLDDDLETLLLNLFYGGRVAALPAVLHSNAGHVPIIRPLLYCRETDISAFAMISPFESVGCTCPVCPIHPDYDEGQGELKRHFIKRQLRSLEKDIPTLYDSARSALKQL